jgi:hypothetical protein
MSDEPKGDPVPIIGKERTHPALRLLARAAIAMARLGKEPKESVETTAPQGKRQKEATDG